MSFRQELLDELLKSYKKPEDLMGENGIMKQLTKALLERALTGEMTHHLGYERSEKRPDGQSDYRNGKTSKKVLTKDGVIEVAIPRDRSGSFEPQLIQKHQRRFDGFDDKIISMYARGMTVREIQAHLIEIYGVEVSPDFISTVTDEVIGEVTAWQMRPLDPIYPIVYCDAMIIKIKDNGRICNKALYLIIGVNMQGNKEVLGIWIAQNEGAKFWLSVITELKNRGVSDIFIACVDGLKGFPEAINSVFPATQIQLCIVHIMRNSLNYVPWKDRKKVATDLKEIYNAPSVEAAWDALDRFRRKWEIAYPTIGAMWERNWHGIIPFLAYPPNIRKAIYTTNAIESTNRSLRKIVKIRTIFPDDKAALKLVYLALNNISKKWTKPIWDWHQALNQFAIVFGERVPQSL